MNLESRKIELAKMILGLENEELIEKILRFIKGDVIEEKLTKSELEQIDLGIKLSKKGQRKSFEDYLKKVS